MNHKIDLEGLLSRYMIYLWAKSHFGHTDDFEIDPEMVDTDGIRKALKIKIRNKYFPVVPPIEKLIEEFRQQKDNSFKDAVKLIETVVKTQTKEAGATYRIELKSLNNLPDKELILRILKNYRVHLKQTDLDHYEDLYNHLKPFYHGELKTRNLQESQEFLIQKMAGMLDEYTLAARWDVNFTVRMKKSQYDASKEQYHKIKDESIILLQAMYKPKFIVSEDESTERAVVTAMMVKFLAQYENWLEKMPKIDPSAFSEHPSTVDFEKHLIAHLDLKIKERRLQFESKELRVTKNVWNAELLNFMRHIKKKEWRYIGSQFPFKFPYRKSGKSKIESAITEMKKK